MKSNILVVDDDNAIAQLVATCLKEQGYSIRRAANADAGIALLRKERFDLVLLDISLPGISGLQALDLIKRDPATQDVPVIMLTSHAEEAFKVRGLQGGADDYIVKPFSLKELSARVEALFRRIKNGGNPEKVLAGAGISMDLDRRQVISGRLPVNLTPSEYELLGSLIRQKGRVLTYRVLADSLSDQTREPTSQSLYQIVKNLRRKLGRSGEAIETVYGIGYRMLED